MRPQALILGGGGRLRPQALTLGGGGRLRPQALILGGAQGGRLCVAAHGRWRGLGLEFLGSAADMEPWGHCLHRPCTEGLPEMDLLPAPALQGSHSMTLKPPPGLD